ncbi:MAG: hypothetical protein RRA15_06395 [bacterium]|nr:hypothetical protein [bacterium]MDT8366104.1 hypothetical protein [bacterium]
MVRILPENLQGRFTAGDSNNAEPLVGEMLLQHVPDDCLVIGNEDLDLLLHPAPSPLARIIHDGDEM